MDQQPIPKSVLDRLQAEAVHEIQTADIQQQTEDHLRELVRTVHGVRHSRAWKAGWPIRIAGKVAKQLTNESRKASEWDPLRHPEHVLNSWRELKRRPTTHITDLNNRLLGLGFEQSAYGDLRRIVMEASLPQAREAAWHLALWHANQVAKDDYKQTLAYIEIARLNQSDAERLRWLDMIETEALEATGEIEAAKQLLDKRIEQEPEIADLYLARANCEVELLEKTEWINRALELSDITPIQPTDDDNTYDSLPAKPANKRSVDGPLISVIIPAYNAAGTIKTALDSMLNQTWKHLEILVVDDGSSDDTVEVVKGYSQQHPEVQLLHTPNNSGPYVARNEALKQVRGELITTTDSDDWSHPQKLERQARHLMDNEQVVANTSQTARCFEDLRFYRRGQGKGYVQLSMSSLMFRHEPVLDALGNWDSVRFAADAEFIHRLRAVFGHDSLVHLPDSLLSFQRQSEDTLTGSGSFGYHGFFMGARKEYREAHEHYHTSGGSLCYPYPMDKRPFAVPHAMLPERSKEQRRFDVALVSDFTDKGGSNMSNIEEIKAHKRLGLKTALVQLYRYDARSERGINPKIRELMDGESVEMVVYGESIACDLLLLRYPPALQHRQRYVPSIEANHVKVAINQTPMSDYGGDGEVRYELATAQSHLEAYFGQAAKQAEWHPIGPLVRQALNEHHVHELESINLSGEDWLNIIDIEEWRRDEPPFNTDRPKIGRHARDAKVKWPEPEQILLAYPESDDVAVHILGGADWPQSQLGHLPRNWRVYEYGEVSAAEFLAELDVFVYFPHPDLVESYGRVIFEAMATGVPVILPPHFESVFGDAAIYCDIEQVQDEISKLMQDKKRYIEQVQKAWEYVESNCSYEHHEQRLKPLIENL